jgi:hypothetical protein
VGRSNISRQRGKAANTGVRPEGGVFDGIRIDDENRAVHVIRTLSWLKQDHQGNTVRSISRVKIIRDPDK